MSRRMLEHYLRYDEASRLEDEEGMLERVRSQRIIERHLPPPPATVLDVGGGPGIYARWLLERGYDVHLVDPVPKHVTQATGRLERWIAAGTATCSQGSAASLPLGDGAADAVLLLGPLYHLQERDDRLAALAEARRALRHGGPLFAAGITRFASLLSGLDRGFLADPVFAAIVERDLACGRHENPTENPSYFTDAYFHRPEELAGELAEAGFRDVRVLAVEGPLWLGRHFARFWNDPPMRERMLDLLEKIEAEPSLQGASCHLMAVGLR